jgi:glucose-1-phosphate adenylyltransferase
LAKEIPGVGIGDNCYLENCVIDKNARIGDNVKISGGKHLQDTETDSYVVKEGIVVVKNGAVISSGTEI